MKITLLGTGSPVPMTNRASSGYLVEVGDEILVFDHGAGAHQNFLKTGYKATDLNTIFFTHLHTDHCLDYARLVHSRWDQGGWTDTRIKSVCTCLYATHDRFIVWGGGCLSP